ncbi:Na/Pi cotransporter family protein [Clostridium sp. BIOML-A1]|jgi:Na/Pi-cotransporter II-like protein|uniref:Na/Pi cotransporter family protein n=1 Tax=Clostridium sp. BIOML-A1 TaxID=2584627 RepID=UPI001370E3DF|nr:Na/Pi cotransporter family protein [Clostridium sp. BIOML-A1]MZH18002.1 Na/Pi cotransporter family protein [Clostridium sp. BIOML-A1]
MSIFDVLALFGGLALFLFGMNVMGDGLTRAAGGKMERILEKLTSTPIKGVLLGAAVTAVIQSSSATTVMVVGFVNSGIMKLRQAVGIIMGANIGTTVTSWILSLSGIQGDSIWIQMLKPSSFSPILAVIGIAFLMFSKNEKKHDIGMIFLGFTILMYGMDAMSGAVAPLADVPEFANVLLMFSNPVLGMIVGTLFTAIIQSSSASVGILQALCMTGAVTYGTALPIIMGQNIGTCVTALLSSIGAKKNAKRAAFVHLYFNLIGTILFMIVFYSINAFVNFGVLQDMATPAGIAVIHSIFNILTTIVLLPFGKGLEKLATLTIREKEEPVEEIAELVSLKHLDARFLEQPAFAVTQSMDVMNQMAGYSAEALYDSLELMKNYSDEKWQRVEALEDIVDKYEDELGTYLAKVSGKELAEEDSKRVSNGLHCIGDLERISDHALAIAEIYAKMHKEEMVFSDKAMAELNLYSNAVYEIMSMTCKALNEDDMKIAKRIEPLEEVINGLNATIKKQHIKRLQKGKCTIELGIALENLLNNYERVADHCSNVAASLLQVKTDSFDMHEYLNRVKQESNVEFQAMYSMYKEKYSL